MTNRQTIKRIRELHKPYECGGFIQKQCCIECNQPYPCATLQTINKGKHNGNKD